MDPSLPVCHHRGTVPRPALVLAVVAGAVPEGCRSRPQQHGAVHDVSRAGQASLNKTHVTVVSGCEGNTIVATTHCIQLI